jgi:site-specific recombinase XerD
VGSSPTRRTTSGRLAQRLEHLSYTQGVTGSNPVSPTTKLRKYHGHPVFSGITLRESVLDPLYSMNIDEALREYLMDQKIGNRSPRTIEYRQLHIGDFISYAKTASIPLKLTEITPQYIKLYLSERTVHKWSLRAKYLCLHALFNWAIKQGYVEHNPLDMIDKPVMPKTVTPIVTEDEITRVLKQFDTSTFLGKRNSAVILVLLDTGIRLSELCAIKMQDVDIEGGYLKVQGKGNKERIVAIGDVTRKALWQYIKSRHSAPHSELWLTEEFKPLSAQGWKTVIRRVKERLGITKKFSTHVMRHTAAVSLLRNGMDMKSVQRTLGHTSLQMTDHYVDMLTQEDVLKKHKQFSPMDSRKEKKNENR